MNRLALAFLLAFSPTARGDHVVTQAPTITDSHGQVHGLGYLGRGKEHRTGVLYWAPRFVGPLPAAYDLRDLKAVSPIKNQGSCGSCWAFSVTKALESALLRGNLPLSLSEQESVSCNSKQYGCNGGMMDAMDYLVTHGLPTDAAYPYTARDSRCSAHPVAAKGLTWGYVGSKGRGATTDEIRAALVTYGVLSVTVAAGGDDWGGGNGGVMTDCGVSGTNHMVNLVGWKEDGKLIGANSWGSNWGDKGFFYAAHGCDELGTGPEAVSFVTTDTGPAPVPHVRLPAEVDILPGTEVMLGVRPQDGVTYSWLATPGAPISDTQPMVYVTPTADTTYTLRGHTSAGDAESAVKVHLLLPDYD